MKKELSALKPLFILLPLLVLGFVLFWYVARSNGGHWKIVNLGQG